MALKACKSLALVFCTFLLATSAMAEGSRSLYPSTYSGTNNARAELDFSNTSQRYVNRVHRFPFLYLFANQGEYILLGSRNRTANGYGAISVYNPQSFGVPGDETIPPSADYTCSSGTTGLIASRAQELAGPKSASGVGGADTYAPCYYQAPIAGIYGVVFGVDANASSGLDGIIDPPIDSNNSVSAWDVTIRDSLTSITDINGRLFTYAFIGSTGSNGRSVYSTHYYVTRDGYRYSQQLHGLDPNGYAIYANSLGFLDNGEPLYKDVRGSGAMATPLPSGVTAQIAEYPIFFSDVDPNGLNNAEVNMTLDALGIPHAPPMPTVSNANFVGSVSGSTSTTGAGGSFTFDSTDTISYLIVVSRDGVDFNPDTLNNATVTGIAYTGSHTVAWDGKDNSGANFPPGGSYLFKIEGRNGEAHFPLIDAENNFYGGPKLTRLNNPGTSGVFADYTIYYDDRGYVTRGGQLVGHLNGTLCPNSTPAGPNPNNALRGVDSSTYPRAWGVAGSVTNNNTDCLSNGWGDAKGLDLWTFFSTSPQQASLTIIPITIDVATAVSAPATVAPGGTVAGSFSFGNNGTGTANVTGYSMHFPAGLGAVSFGNLPTNVTATYDNSTGNVTFGNAPSSLTSGQFWIGSNGLAQMTYTYTAPSTVPDSLTVTTGITTSDTDTYPTNNTASATTYIGNNDLLTSVSVPASTTPGGSVLGALSYGNGGETAVSGLIDSNYTATFGTAGHHPASVTFTSLPAGVTAIYNPANGQVAFSGMPTTMAAGQSINFAFNYVAQATDVGPIVVNTTILTPTGDANSANNQAAGSTNVLIPDVTTTVSPPATASPGSNVVVPITFSNVGTGSASNVDYSLTLPAGLSGVSCSGASCSYDSTTGNLTVSGLPTSLTAGQSANLVLNYVAPGSGSVSVNSAIATGTWQGTNAATDTASGTTTVGGGTGFDVMAGISAPPSATVGSSATVTVNYTNLGPSTSTGMAYTVTVPANVLSVTCPAPAICSAPTGNVVTITGLAASLSSGQSTGTTLTFTVPASGPLSFSTNVTTPSDSNAGNDTAVAVVAVTNSVAADLTAAISAPASVPVGSTVNALVTYRNLGPSAATNVTYSVTVPAGLGGVTCAPATCTYVGTTVTITGTGFPASLNAGDSVSATLVFVAPSSGPITLTAMDSSSTSDPNPANNSASTSISTTPSADLSIAKSNGVTSVSAGGNTTYTITVTNNGPSEVTGATVVDTAPTGMTIGNWTCSVSNAGTGGSVTTACGAANGSGNLNTTVTMKNGAVITYSVPATVSSSAAGTLSNTATVTVPSGTTDPAPGNNSATDSDTVVSSNGNISGHIWYDLNHNHQRDGNELGRPGWTVELLSGISVLTTTTTDSQGYYSFSNLAPGTYSIRFINPNGGTISTGPVPVNGETGLPINGGGTPSISQLSGIVLTATGGGVSTVAEQSLPLDPSGVVYNSLTRQPIAGATVTLLYNGNPINAIYVVGGSASMVTGADGSYAFFLLPNAPAGTYGLSLSAPGYTFPSVTIPASIAPNTFSGGQVTNISGAPSTGQLTTYYLQFPLPAQDITNNNLPLDPAQATGIPGLNFANLVALMLLMTALASASLPSKRGR